MLELTVEVFRKDSAIREFDGASIQQAINLLAQKEAEALTAKMRHTEYRLSEALNSEATLTGSYSEPARLEQFVRNLRVAEFPLCSIALRRPKTLSISLVIARYSLSQQLQSQSEPALTRFFNNYARTPEL